MARLQQLTLLLISILRVVNANPWCDDSRYGSPHPTDCVLAMSQLVPQNKDVHYFVEEQRRSSPQSPVWTGFVDSRSPSQQKPIVQLPKWTAYGTCHVAIHSFRHRSQSNTAPPVSWFKIHERGMQINQVCLTSQRKGGAAVVIDEQNRAGLGVYMWADGALFQDVVNQEMSDMYPYGMDPTETNDPMELQVGGGNQTGLSKNSTGFLKDTSTA